MEHEQEDLRSFGRCQTGTSEVYKPTCVADVKEVFDFARNSRPQRRIVIRGSGHSFDGQALHQGDDGSEIALSAAEFDNDRIEFHGDRVTLGAGVKWGDFFAKSMAEAQMTGCPLRIPGSMQTGRRSTVAGTLSGDCLSRFSGLGGKESAWIESFKVLTPTSPDPVLVTRDTEPDLFNAVIGGLGYIGFVTEATYRLIEMDAASVARSTITIHNGFQDLVQKQLDLVAAGGGPRGISSAWFRPPLENSIKGAVFDSVFALPSDPKLAPFPLYDDLDSPWRYTTEVGLARDAITNILVHEFLLLSIEAHHGQFEDDILDFLFFMDGNTFAKEKFEKTFDPAQFPIAQQTFVVPAARTIEFSQAAVDKIRQGGLHPTECDMLYVKADECLLSANYKMDGFAITFAFEPLQFGGRPPGDIPQFFRDLSRICAGMGGRIHLTKNVYADGDVFRQMFCPQIKEFEAIKRRYDPQVLLQNTFAERFFKFGESAAAC